MTSDFPGTFKMSKGLDALETPIQILERGWHLQSLLTIAC